MKSTIEITSKKELILSSKDWKSITQPFKDLMIKYGCEVKFDGFYIEHTK